MKYLNRNLITVYIKQELLDWVKKIKPRLSRWTLDNINNDPCTYLIEIEDQNCQGTSIENYCRKIIEHELECLYVEKKYWPNEIDYELFLKWFTYTYHTSVCDLVDYEKKIYES